MVKPEFISGKKLLKKWKIYHFQLFEIVIGGRLLPHNKIGNPVTRPNFKTREEINSWKAEIESLKKQKKIRENSFKLNNSKLGLDAMNQFISVLEHYRIHDLEKKILKYKSHTTAPYDWRKYELPDNEDEAAKIIETVSDYLFLIREAESIEKDSKKREDPCLSDINKQLIIGIGQEAELLYNHIKKAVGVTDKSIKSKSERKQAALAFFKNDPDKFQYIKEEHLENPYVYEFHSNQSKRDFMTRIYKEAELPGYKSLKYYQSWKKDQKSALDK